MSDRLPAHARFAREMRRLRREREWSQEELAERSGLHRNYIGSVERGERNLGLDNAEKIALALGLELTDLLEP